MCACLRQEDSTDNDGDDIDDICRHLTATSMGAIGAPINPIVERYGMSKLSCGWPDWVSGNASTETKFVRICEAARENAEYANRTISRSAALNENINEVGRSRGRARSLFVATSRDVYRPLPSPPLPSSAQLVGALEANATGHEATARRLEVVLYELEIPQLLLYEAPRACSEMPFASAVLATCIRGVRSLARTRRGAGLLLALGAGNALVIGARARPRNIGLQVRFPMPTHFLCVTRHSGGRYEMCDAGRRSTRSRRSATSRRTDQPMRRLTTSCRQPRACAASRILPRLPMTCGPRSATYDGAKIGITTRTT